MKRSIQHPFTVLTVLLFVGGAELTHGIDWPQWRGPDRSDVSKETNLLKSWPAGGPKQLWLYNKAGNGCSGPAIVAGKLFTSGTRDQAECVIALAADTGTELWAAKVG